MKRYAIAALAASAMVPGAIFAQDGQTPEQRNAELDLIKKEQEIRKAELEIAEQERALAEAQRAAERDAQTAERDARSKELEIAEAERALAAAARGDITGSFPSGDTTGKVDVKGNAGLVEAQGLSALAINGMAGAIAHEVATAITENEEIRLLVLSGTQTLTFAHFEQFEFRTSQVEKNYVDTMTTAREAIQNAKQTLQAVSGQAVEPAAGSIAGIGAGVSVAAQLAKLITPDWEVGGIETKPADRSLALAFARAYLAETSAKRANRPLYWQSSSAKLGGSDVVFGALQRLDVKDVEAKQLAEQIPPLLKTVNAELKKLEKEPDDHPVKARLKAAADGLTKAKEALDAASALYTELLKALNGKPGEATLPIDTVITEAATVTLLRGKGLVISLSVDNAAGGYYTRRALWNVFDIGGTPFFATGGATVNYAVVRPSNQQVIAAGLLACHAGYTKISKVADRINRASADACKPAPESDARTGNARRQ